MKLSDYIAEFLVREKIRLVFGVTGGAIAHVFDSIGRNKDLRYICPQHEQAAAMAADAYARVTRNFGVAIATSGPGATNLITGVACSYYDSVPVLLITGQVSTFRLKKDIGVRQIGFQETDVDVMFKPITKYAVLLEDAKMIRYELEKAVYIAKTGRPGPVLVDIPDNLQRAEISPEKLKRFCPPRLKNGSADLYKQIEKSLLLIKEAKRPVVIIGAGVKSGKAERQATEFVEKLNFPVALTWATRDMFASYPLNVGSFGITAPRLGNYVVQNSDLVLSIGSRLDTHAIGTPFSSFAREARKIVVDIDKYEIGKFRGSGMHLDICINACATDFLNTANRKCRDLKTQDIALWVKTIEGWKKKYPPCLPEYHSQKRGVNPYAFLEILSEESGAGDILIADTGSNLAQTMQCYKPKEKQLMFSAFNHSPMGYSIAASIGACFAGRTRRVICLTGDGGIQMNIQELATIAKHGLSVKIFVFNNKGYGMIKQTQDDWLESRYEASSIRTGIAVPDFVKVARAYGLKAERLSSHRNMREKIRKILGGKGAILCDISISEDQRVVPMLKFGRPIEDANPLLDREEFLKNMIVKPMKQSLKRG